MATENGFFSNQTQFIQDPNVSQRENLKGFYGAAVRPAYIEDLVAKAEEAAANSKTFSEQSKQYRDEAEVIRDETQGVYDDTVILRDETQALKNDTEIVYNNTVQVYSDTQALYNNTVILEGQASQSAAEAAQSAQDALDAALATSNGVINRGTWDASTGNFPIPTISPVEKADWYRINVAGRMTNPSNPNQKDITAAIGDNIYWNTIDDIWYLISSDKTPWQYYCQTESDLETTRRQNSTHFAASGFVHYGRHYSSSTQFPINEGMYSSVTTVSADSANLLHMGRDSAKTSSLHGTSKTTFPMTNVAGFISKLFAANGGNNPSCFTIKFQEAPDGTVTYNSTTGEVIQHADAATAFALANTSDDIEVVINRVDMFGAEFFLEEVSQANPFVYPKGMIQYKATSMNGITTTTSNRPVTYYAVYDGDIGSRGRGVDFWAATDEQKKAMVSDETNNIFMLDDGSLVQWRMRQRTIAGAGNGDWFNLTSNITGNGYLGYNSNARIKGQGFQDVASVPNGSSIYDFRTTYAVDNFNQHNGIFTVNQAGANERGVNGECYFHVWGVVPRLNQGAYHPSLNPMGANRFLASNGAWVEWFNATAGYVNSPLDCFTKIVVGGGDIQSGAAACGRPDGRFYDAIYASGQGGVIDYRLSAWDMSSKEEASKIFQKVVNGSYRGKENLKKPLIFAGSLAVTGTSQNIYIDGSGMGAFSKVNDTFYVYRSDGTVQKSSVKTVGANGWISLDHITNCQLVTHVILETETNIPVSGDFTQVDVIGSPAEILATPDLANGWLGGWVAPGTTGEAPLVRKAVAQGRTTVLSSVGNWNNTTSGLNTTKNTVYNHIVVESAKLAVVDYTAFAKQTKSSANKAVLNGSEGVGVVLATDGYLPKYGSVFVESLIGKVATNTVNMVVLHPLTRTGFLEDGKLFTGDSNHFTTHESIELPAPTNNSPAVKTLWYQAATNGQVGLNFAYNELKYKTGVENPWGDTVAGTTYSSPYGQVRITDGQDTYTNLNGDVCLYGSNELTIPYGYTKNHARAGEQTEGVDL